MNTIRTARTRLTAALAVAAGLAGAQPAAAITLPNGFEERTLASGLQAPTAAAWAPDGRLFVAQKPGQLAVVAPGSTTPTTILDLSTRVNDGHDRGLLGLAVDSSYAENRFVYLLYTYDVAPLNADDPATRTVSQLLRVVVNADNSIGEQKVILGTYTSGVCPAPSNTVDCIPSEGLSHSIGSVRSAPDGTLWVGSGDAASFGGVDPLAFRTYDERSLAGKIMRVDREGRGLAGHSFCPSNTDLTQNCTKLYAKGFRNPFRFALRPNGGLTVGDVGWNQREEIDLIGQGGKSYGWPCYEGNSQTGGYRDRSECPPEYAKEGGALAHTNPDFDYPHSVGSTVIGGPTYTGNQYPAGYGDTIFYGDYSAGTISRLTLGSGGEVTANQSFATGWSGGVGLELTPAGNLAYVDIGTFSNDGAVREVVYSPGNRAPLAVASASQTSGPAPLTVDFDGSGSSDPDNDPLTYDWDFGDSSAHSSSASPRHVYTSPGAFTARLTVSDGRGRSSTRDIAINPGGSAPVPAIEAPLAEALYRGGDSVALRGSASDAQDGAIPASGLSWRVVLHHGSHLHQAASFDGVAQASFQAVRDHDADSYYEITLTARDSLGLTGSKTVSIRPKTVTASIESTPSGAPMSFAGRDAVAPFTQTTASGFDTTVSAGESFVSDGRTFRFDRWEDGGERARALRVPDTSFALRAIYKEDKSAGRPASASSFEGPGFEASKALDGDPNTRWSSVRADGEYWQVDLGRARSVDEVRLDWEFAHARRYRILTSTDGITFGEAAQQTIPGPGKHVTAFAPRTARYVRVESLERATVYGISLFEAVVLGPADAADGSPPQTTIDSGPSGTTTSGSPVFAFSSEAGATFECRLDGSAWRDCASPDSFSNLGVGDHLYEVRATDASGNTDASPASRAFAVDYGTEKARGRPATASTTEAGGFFGAANAVDSDAFSRWSSLAADDQHWQVDLGSVRTVDRVQLDWETAYAKRYRILTSTDGSTFTVAAEQGIAGPGVAVTPFSAPRDARYVRVLALERGTQYGISLFDARVFGQPDAPPVDPTPPDTTPPDTGLSGGPASPTDRRDATFSFTSEPAAGFECSLDSATFAPCTSPKTLSALAPGDHSFQVRAIDAAGNVDPSPAAHTWTVRASYADAVLSTPALFSFYRLGDPDGSARDAKGGPAGAYRNGPRTTGGLVFGNDGARDFDGVNDYVDLSPAAFGAPTSFSVEAWVRLDRVKPSGGYHFLVTNASDDLNDGFSLVVDSANQPQLRVARSSSVRATATAPAVAPNRPVHIVGTYSPTGLRLYVDGVRRATVAYTGGVSWSSARDLLLASQKKSSNRSARYLDGQLDEVALYSSALTDAQVEAHHATGRPPASATAGRGRRPVRRPRCRRIVKRKSAARGPSRLAKQAAPKVRRRPSRTCRARTRR